MKTLQNYSKKILRLLTDVLAVGVLAVGVFDSSSDLFAQNIGGGKTVSNIDVVVRGNQSINRERVLSHMRLRTGSKLTQEALAADIVSLYASGFIENASIESSDTTGGAALKVIVTPKASVGRVSFVGNKNFSNAWLRKRVKISEGNPVNEAELAAAKLELLEYYNKKGYADATIRYVVKDSATEGFSDVYFQINEGEKKFISDIDFSGNSAIASKELKGILKIKEKGFLSFITGSGRFNSYDLEDDIERIERHYQNKGYLNAKVRDVDIREEKGKAMLTYIIEEGEVYNINRVGIAGSSTYPSSELGKLIQVRSNQPYSGDSVRTDVKSISNFLGSKGHADARVFPNIEASGGNNVSIDYNVSEGRKYLVNKINVSGNTKTKDKVLRRELAISPGEILNTVKIDASSKRLQNTGYFAKVNITPIDAGTAGYKDININVEEKRTGTINFGASFTSIDNLAGFIDITQSNFDWKNPPSFTGAGQKFRMSLKAGVKRRDFIVSFVEPWFLDKRLAIGGDLFWREYYFFSDDYDQRNIGGDIFLKTSIGEHSYAKLEYKLQQIEIFDIDDNASDVIRAEEGEFMQSKLALTLVRDTRDSYLIPRKGGKYDIGAYTGIGADVETYGVRASASKYFTLPLDVIINMRGRFESVDGSGNVPIFERHFLGGANNLRGFDYREVSPKDVNGEPIGGNTSLWGTAELTFPIMEKLRGAIFYDIGVVNEDSWDTGTSNFNSNYGFGVRIFTGFGPINLDFGIPIEADEHNDSNGKFNFNVGTVF